MLAHSFRLRLTLWYVAFLALVLVGFGLALHYSLRTSLSNSVDSDLRARGRGMAERIGRGPGMPYRSPQDRPPQQLQAGATEAERRGYFRRPRVMNAEGGSMIPLSDDEPWDHDTYLLALGGKEHFSNVTVEGEPLRVFSVPIFTYGDPSEKVEGVIQVAHPLSEQRRLISGLVRTLLTVIPVALALAALGGLFLTDRALLPVRRISETAAQIGAEDLSRRLEVTGRDELSQLAATFNGMIGRLEEAFGKLETAYLQQRRFIADASHELRTPLTTIKANTSLALVGEPSIPEYREALQAADQAADTMNRIVQDLLLLARTDGGQLGMERRPVALGTVLQQAAAQVGRRDRAPIAVHLPSEPAGVLGDAHHLSRLFVNLLENAVRHTPPDGRIDVAVRAESAPGSGDPRTVVTVADTGEGIPPEHLPHVCERFYRVDSARARAQGGTGLGLAICQSIVQAHEGDLSIESTVGAGTTVRVTLPAAEVPAPATGELVGMIG